MTNMNFRRDFIIFESATFASNLTSPKYSAEVSSNRIIKKKKKLKILTSDPKKLSGFIELNLSASKNAGESPITAL